MTAARRFSPAVLRMATLVALASVGVSWAQTCEITPEIEPARLQVIHAAAQHFADRLVAGDASLLSKTGATTAATEFPPITRDTFKHLAPVGSRTLLTAFSLDASDEDAIIPRAEFLCGTFAQKGQSANSAIFTLTNLRPAVYAMVEFSLAPAKPGDQAATLTLVMQREGADSSDASKPDAAGKGDWKLAAAFVQPATLAGHDLAWFTSAADKFAEKKQRNNAWLYYRVARTLASPLPFMSTLVTDQLYDAMRRNETGDLPGIGTPLETPAHGNPSLLDVEVHAVDTQMALMVRYRSPNLATTEQATAQGVSFIRGFIGAHSEFRDAFFWIVAYAVTPEGKELQTKLRITDVH